MPRPASPLAYIDDALCTACWRNVQVCVFARAMRREHVAAIEAAYQELVRAHPDGVLGLVVMLPHPPLTDRSVLQAMERVLRDLGPRLLQTAVVIDLGGLWSMLVRAMLRGMSVAARSSRIQLHGALEDAVAALGPRVRPLLGAGDADELASLVALMKGHLGRGDLTAGAAR